MQWLNRHRTWRLSLLLPWLMAGLVAGLSVGLQGCSTLDERDECCEEVTLFFRYSKGAQDEFPIFIKRMEYLIFDAQGKLQHHFTKEVGNLQQLKLFQVDAGTYHVVAVGNAGAATQLGIAALKELTLEMVAQVVGTAGAAGARGDGDPLYYGYLTYEVAPTPLPQSFLCDMSNAHARLIATIRWADSQPKGRDKPYSLELLEVPAWYQLGENYPVIVTTNLSSTSTLSTKEHVVHRFPLVGPSSGAPLLVTHAKEAPYLAGRVRGELRTLRYTDEWIPLFRVTQGGVEVMPPLPLARIFKELKWAVSQNIEQVYELEFTLYDDGRIEVRAGGQLQVIDWVNGGTVG